jgi:hypothetical protein
MRIATTAPMRANVYVIAAISARSRRPTSEGASASEPSSRVTFLKLFKLDSIILSEIEPGTTHEGAATTAPGRLLDDLLHVSGGRGSE